MSQYCLSCLWVLYTEYYKSGDIADYDAKCTTRKKQQKSKNKLKVSDFKSKTDRQDTAVMIGRRGAASVLSYQ